MMENLRSAGDGHSSFSESLRSACRRFKQRLRERMLLAENVRGLTGGGLRATGTPLVDRFSHVLSVRYFSPETGLFFLNDGAQSPVSAMGCVFELEPALACESALTEGFERMFSCEMPGPCVFSVSTYASASAVRTTLREYVQSRSGGTRLEEQAAAVLKEMAVRRARMLDDRARSLAAQSHTPVRHFRVWLSVVCAPGEAEMLSVLEGRNSHAHTQFARARQAIESALRQSGLFFYAWDDRDWIETVRELVNPQKVAAGLLPSRSLRRLRSRSRAHDFVQPESLRSAAVLPDTMIDIEREAIVFSSPAAKRSRDSECLSRETHAVEAVGLAVTGLPARTHLSHMRLVLGSASALKARIGTPFLWTTSVQPTSIEQDRSITAVKHARVRQLMNTEIGQFLTDLSDRHRDLELAKRACEEGRGLARIAQSLVVYAAPGKAAAAAHNAANVLAAAGLQAYVNVGLQVMDLMQGLPLEAGVSLMRDIKTAGRAFTVTREAAGHLLPLAGEYRGSPARAGESSRKPMLMLVTRSGELMPVDIFANRNGNYNAVVTGTSGSGKSVLTQELVTSVLATGGRVWVFDIGKSYETCVELARGQFIDFEKTAANGAGICLNPLDMMGEDPAESLDEVAQIIAAMANGNAPMEMTAMELVKVNIAAVVQKARSEKRVPQLADLVLQLMSTRDPALHDVAVRLSPFAAGGRFASWFEGRANVNFESALVVLEMEALANRPVLQSAVLLILIMRILQEIRTCPRSEKKLIVIDEAWRLLTGEAAGFIEWATRTLRKYGAGIVCVSQSMEDFRMSASARAVRANADSVFLFRQKPEGIAAFTGDAALQQTLMGLTTVSESFSEVWAKVGDAPGVVARLILDDFSMTAFSTRADVFEAVRREKARGRSALEAISIVAEKGLEAYE